MTRPPTIAQLHNLADRAATGLTPDEQQRLRDGIDHLHQQAEAATPQPPPTTSAQPTITHTHTWDGSRTLPDWLTGHHHWHDDQLVIHTPDRYVHPEPGWWLIGWSDGTVTAASPTSGERVYGADGIADRLARAETATDGELRRQLADTIRALGKAETELAGVRALRDRWVKAGPPPLGTPISRWWDRRLAELGAVLNPEQPGPG